MGPGLKKLLACTSYPLKHLLLESSCHAMRKPREPHGETSVEKTQYEFASRESELENGSFSYSQAIPTDPLCGAGMST